MPAALNSLNVADVTSPFVSMVKANGNSIVGFSTDGSVIPPGPNVTVAVVTLESPIGPNDDVCIETAIISSLTSTKVQTAV